MAFHVFEHTADVGIAVEAPSLAALFQDAARGLISVVRSDNPVASERSFRIDVTGDRLDRLFVAFLEEFIFLQDAEGVVFDDVTEVSVTQQSTDSWQASAEVTGEPFDHTRHPGCLHVKAVTRHGLEVSPPTEGTPARARFILDI